MNKIAIIHFYPLEYYPPVQNLIRYLETRKDKAEVYIFTTPVKDDGLAEFATADPLMHIIRIGKGGEQSAGKRYLNYFSFYATCIRQFRSKKIQAVLYYETISSYPAYIYKRWFNKRADIFIHYHEYTSGNEFENGMKLVRYLHRLEKKMYADAAWLSHTNAYRMELFLNDIAPVKLAHPQILPNYPPRSWKNSAATAKSSITRFVYVGALSTETMYCKEFGDWIMKQEGKATWDVYSFNITADAKKYLLQLDTNIVRLHPGVDYEKLPQILKGYDVGVVLYNGHIPNYIFNAPNKLFEYAACGLEVLFPQVMTGAMDHVTTGTFPEITALDFTLLDSYNLNELISKEGLSQKDPEFFSENVLEKLCDEMLVNR